MIVHLLAPSVYCKDYYSFLIRNFRDDEFAVFCNAKPNSELFKNAFDEEDLKKNIIPVYQPISWSFLKYMFKCDGIVIHGMFNIWYTAFLTVNPWLLKKCNWVVWGGDLYPQSFKESKVKSWLRSKLKKSVASRIGFLTTVADSDLLAAKELYGFRGIHLKTKYPTPLTRPGNYEMLAEMKTIRDSRKGIQHINIMIGNSATRTNQHFEALDMISKYRDEDITIYLPLSYGIDSDYKEYGKSVEDYAVKIFGREKVIPLYERLDGTDYYKVISQVDVGLFNCNRQQAMGNITILLAGGAKVYIRNDTSMWEEYSKRGNVMFDIMSIPNLGFKDFATLSDHDRDTNAEIIYDNASNEANLRRWEAVFSVMKDKRR